MLHKFLIWVCALLVALTPIAYASASVQAEIDAILAYATEGRPLQDWVDSLTENHAGSADNYILALNRMGADVNTAGYGRALAKVQERNPVTRMGSALVMLSCGTGDLIPAGLPDEAIGELGLMSYIYGLLLLNNGVPSEKWTADSVVQALLERRLEDGGWAVSARFADADATAMCLHALAGYRGEIELDAVIAETVALLSTMQNENAGFSSYGVENPESSAQVILALTAAGVDPLSDERFIKNGRTLLDAMLDFKLPSGGYAHSAGGKESDMAAMQVLQALSVLQHKQDLYDFSGTTAAEMPAETLGWKAFALIGIGAAALAGMVLSLIKKRGRIKRLIFVLLITAIAAGAVLMINVESADSYYSTDAPVQADGHAYLSIRCDTVAGRRDDGSTPADGVILPRTRLAFGEGETVFDLLTRAARQHRIQLEYEGVNASMAYIDGINYLYELDFGDLSGWVYTVNGQQIAESCGSHPVKDGDEIIWAYTTELGEDIK